MIIGACYSIEKCLFIWKSVIIQAINSYVGKSFITDDLELITESMRICLIHQPVIQTDFVS